MTIAEQIVYAMFKPSKYKEMLQLKKGRFAAFVVIIMLVLGIVTFVIPSGAFITGFGGFKKLFENQLSTLSFRDGALSLEHPFRMDIGEVTVLINTEHEQVQDEQLRHDGVYIAIGSRLMRMAFTVDGRITDYQISDITGAFPEGFDNKSLIQMIPSIYVYMVMVFLFSCLGFFIKYAVAALVYSLFINFVNKNMELHLSYGEVFRLCFYGQTLGIILSNFNSALGWLPVTLVSIIGIFISIHMITLSVALMNPRNQV